MNMRKGRLTGARSVLPFQDVPRHFVERKEEAAALRNFVLDPQGRRVVIISGMGGVGKTTLARAIWQDSQVRETFQDGVLWATVGSESNIAQAQVAWAAMVSDMPMAERIIAADTPPSYRTSLLRSLLHDRRYLLIIDDVWDSASLADLLVGGPNCAAIITTRIRSVADAVTPHVVDLDVFNPAQARELLERRSGVSINDDRRAAVEQLAVRLGNLPLALDLVAAQMHASGETWEEIAGTVDSRLSATETNNLIDALFDGTTMPACFDGHMRVLQPDLAERLVLLGVFEAGHDATFDAAAAAAVWEVSQSQSRRDLGALFEHGLLNRDTRGYWLHPLLRDYLAKRLQPVQRREAHIRHADYYHQHVARASEENWQAAETALPQMRVAWRTAMPDPERAFAWASALTVFLGRRSLWNDYQELVTSADAAVKRMGWRGYEGRCANWLGVAHRAASTEERMKQARDEFQRSLALMREVGDNYGQATALTNLGNLAYQQGDFSLALDYYERSQARWPKSARAKQVDTLINRASIARINGDHTMGLQLCQEALNIAQREFTGNREQEAAVLAEMGLLYSEHGTIEQAQAAINQSQAIMEQLGNRVGVAVAWLNLGLIAFAAKDFPKAEQYFVQVVAANERTTMATALSNLGLTLAQDDTKVSKALSALNDGLILAQESKDRQLQAVALRNIADIRRRQNSFDEVLALLRLVHALYHDMGVKHDMDVVQHQIDAMEQAAIATPLAHGFQTIYHQVWSDTLNTKSRVTVADTINFIQQELSLGDDADNAWLKDLFNSLEHLAPKIRIAVEKLLSDSHVAHPPRSHTGEAAVKETTAHTANA